MPEPYVSIVRYHGGCKPCEKVFSWPRGHVISGKDLKYAQCPECGEPLNAVKKAGLNVIEKTRLEMGLK